MKLIGRKGWAARRVEIKMNGGIMEVLSSFKHLRNCFSMEGGVYDDVNRRVEEVLTTFGAMTTMFHVRSVSFGV